jgi:hypothetical protein
MKKLFILMIILIQYNGCSDTGTAPVPDPTISLLPESVTISNNSHTEITVNISNFTQEIFAISMQLNFDTDILSFDENSGFSVGDFFSQKEIILVRQVDNNIHFSISLMQGAPPIKGTGTLCKFALHGVAIGNCILSINETELFFYDTAGNPKGIANLQIGSSSISVN